MRDTSAFAVYLREAMRVAGIDPDQRGGPAELARRAGLDDTQVSRWLTKGSKPTIERLRSIAPVLHVSMTDLLLAAGYLQPHEVTTHPATAEEGIRSDASISDREKRLLLTLLSEMRTRNDVEEPSPPAPQAARQHADDEDGMPDAQAV